MLFFLTEELKMEKDNLMLGAVKKSMYGNFVDLIGNSSDDKFEFAANVKIVDHEIGPNPMKPYKIPKDKVRV